MVCCGDFLEEDSVVRLHRKKREMTAITVNWVTDGVDHCHVGFLPRAYVSTRISKIPVLVRALPVSERVPVLVRAYARFSTGFAFSARLFGGQSRFDPADNACQNKIERGAP